MNEGERESASKDYHFYHIYDKTCVNNGTVFEEKNSFSLDIIKNVEEWLKGYGLVAITSIICAYSINIKLPKGDHQRCNLMIISQAGQGKTTLLRWLASLRPKMFRFLPDKPYESLLVKKGDEFYHRKVLLQGDMAIGFGGLRKQQAEQLLGFFTGLLSDGIYTREHNKIEADCVAIFAIATGNFTSRRESMITSTFSDRFAFLKRDISKDEREDNLRASFDETPPPKLELKYYKNSRDICINIDAGMREEIIKLSMELDDYQVMTQHRSKNFIILFMKSNALLNGRTEAIIEDLEMYKQVHGLFLASSRMLEETFVLKNALSQGMKNTEICQMLGWSQSKFYRVQRRLKNESRKRIN